MPMQLHPPSTILVTSAFPRPNWHLHLHPYPHTSVAVTTVVCLLNADGTEMNLGDFIISSASVYWGGQGGRSRVTDVG